MQGRNVLKKEPMSKDINESDSFLYNSSFHSKFYKVKIGTVSAQKETEPEKQETRQKVCLISILPAQHIAPYVWRCCAPTRQGLSRRAPADEESV